AGHTLNVSTSATCAPRGGPVVRPEERFGAAVGQHDRAAEEAGVGAEEEGDQGGDLVGTPAPADGDRELVEEGADLLVGPDLGRHRRLDVPRRDGVEGDAGPGPSLPWRVAAD